VYLILSRATGRGNRLVRRKLIITFIFTGSIHILQQSRRIFSGKLTLLAWSLFSIVRFWIVTGQTSEAAKNFGKLWRFVA
jgi:hypothetical protein